LGNLLFATTSLAATFFASCSAEVIFIVTLTILDSAYTETASSVCWMGNYFVIKLIVCIFKKKNK